MANRKNQYKFILKLIFGLTIIIFVLYQNKTSIPDIIEEIGKANPGWIILSFSLHSLGLLFSAIRWQILIHAQNMHAPLGFLLQSYLVGSFFNNILPTRIGGDIVRIWDGARYSRSIIKSSAIILVERFTGIFVLFLFALGASLWRIDMAHKIPVIWISLVLGILGLIAAVFFFLPVTGRLLQKLPVRGILQKTKDKIVDLRETILFYRNRRKALSKASLWAFMLQVNVVLHYYLIGKALHLKIPLVDYFIFVPIVHLILLIPITINGLGLREGSYVEIFEFYGIAPAIAIVFSLVDLAFMLTVGLIGGIIYIIRK